MNVVNETNGFGAAEDCDAANYGGRIGPGLDVEECLGIDNGIVFHIKLGMGIDTIDDKLARLLYGVVSSESLAPTEHVVDV